MKTIFFIILTMVALCDWHISPVSAASGSDTTYTSQPLPFDPTTGAQGLSGGPGLSTITTLDLGKQDPVSVTIALVNILLTLLGLGFLVLLVYAGGIWIWAKGNEEQITKAKTIMKRSLLGFIIVLSTYGISYLTFYLVNTYAQTTTTSS